MTDPRDTLARIRAQADAATEGPWEVSPFTWKPGHPIPSSEWLGIEATGPVKGEVARIRPNDDEDDANAEFIAAARTTVPALLDLVDDLLERHVEGPTFYGHGFSLRICECGASWPCPDYTAATTALEATK